MRCERLLPISEFKPRAKGFTRTCSECLAPTERRCNRCHITQPVSNFTRRKNRADVVGGYSSLCHACHAGRRYDTRQADPERALAYQKDWRKRNKTRRTEQYRLRKYGLTPEAYEALFASQDQSCAICKTTEPSKKYGWAIDHDHVTGRVRGILCHECNKTLGIMRDDPERLRRAADYIEALRHQAPAVP